MSAISGDWLEALKGEFHQPYYAKLYKTPECASGDWIDTTWAFRNYDKDYKVIIVGDAGMAPEEFKDKTVITVVQTVDFQVRNGLNFLRRNIHTAFG